MGRASVGGKGALDGGEAVLGSEDRVWGRGVVGGHAMAEGGGGESDRLFCHPFGRWLSSTDGSVEDSEEMGRC